MIQYYKVDNPNTGKIASVYRFENDGKGLWAENYDDLAKKWVDYPDIVGSITGAGRDMDLIPIGETEAREFVEKELGGDFTHHKKKKSHKSP